MSQRLFRKLMHRKVAAKWIFYVSGIFFVFATLQFLVFPKIFTMPAVHDYILNAFNVVLYVCLFLSSIYVLPVLNTKWKIFAWSLLVPYFLSVLILCFEVVFFIGEFNITFDLTMMMVGILIAPYFFLGGWFSSVCMLVVCTVSFFILNTGPNADSDLSTHQNPNPQGTWKNWHEKFPGGLRGLYFSLSAAALCVLTVWSWELIGPSSTPVEIPPCPKTMVVEQTIEEVPQGWTVLGDGEIRPPKTILFRAGKEYPGESLGSKGYTYEFSSSKDYLILCSYDQTLADFSRKLPENIARCEKYSKTPGAYPSIQCFGSSK